ncbi:hypothetical protein [Flammeovirga sp. SJP92]|uniref:hypothetical protein n=1 Tax=Flammeovirga sp. SJP92 TaxID=1775430 RepID=UPI0007896C28|nr:hypothetical protein [Flammeovirga sp. SJP92]KXX69709.1 hypothetical protein AVL50_12505 [Flammeovirga sp. SJP92]
MKTYTNFILLLFLFSCENHKQEIEFYQQKIAELDSINLILENKVKEGDIQINTLKGVTDKWDQEALRETNELLLGQFRTLKMDFNRLSKKGKTDPKIFYPFLEFNLPAKLYKSFQLLSDTYRISLAVNPFYVKGHFNEDEVEDYAIFIENIENNKQGLAVFMGGDFEKYYVFGAGYELNKDGFDLNGTLALSVTNTANVWIKEDEPEPVIKSPQVIYIGFTNFSSSVAYLEDEKLKLYWQAD